MYFFHVLNILAFHVQKPLMGRIVQMIDRWVGANLVGIYSFYCDAISLLFINKIIHYLIFVYFNFDYTFNSKI